MKSLHLLKKTFPALLILLLVTTPGYMSQRPKIGLVLSGGGAKAMRATMSIPTLFSPVEWEGKRNGIYGFFLPP